ncbi:MAG: SDR family NAD(P)-dependent oxidoreductase [Acidobacteriaceae bacterium]|nr:SDR family NAD(P)-dependent oxidoreductase [Acidobacteriaceae bacterium]
MRASLALSRITLQLDGSVILISGASEGIGCACAAALRGRGAKISACALPGSRWELPADDGVQRLEGDIADENFRRFWLESAIGRFGRIEGLINNVGIGLYAPATTAPLDEVRRLFDVNVFAALGLTQLIAPVMRRHHSGFIVNIGSVGGQVSLPWAAMYCASKFALHAINDSLRRELSPDGIHVMKVCPGIVETRFREHVLSGVAPHEVSGIRRTVTPERVAEAVVRGIERRSRTVYVPRIGKLFTSLDEISSRVMDWYLARKWTNARIQNAADPRASADY